MLLKQALNSPIKAALQQALAQIITLTISMLGVDICGFCTLKEE
jgi:hypothetical protein